MSPAKTGPWTPMILRRVQQLGPANGYGLSWRARRITRLHGVELVGEICFPLEASGEIKRAIL